MDLSTFEIIWIIIWLIPGLLLVLGFILLISGYFKKELDKDSKDNDSGVFGWIVAIIIAIAILWAICKPDKREPEYRHSYNYTKSTEHKICCALTTSISKDFLL